MIWLSIIVSLLMFTQVANASHFKGGNISWKVISGDTTEITVTSVWRTEHSVPSLQSATGVQLTELSSQVVSVSNGFYTRVTKYQGIVPNNGNEHEVFFSGCCRVSNLSNTGTSGNFRVFSKINLNNGNQYSPISTVASIVKIPINNNAATFNIPASDLDGDNLTYRLATLAELGKDQPVGVSVSNNGLVTVNTTLSNYEINQLYVMGVIISDGSSEVLIDFQLEITGTSIPPDFNYISTPLNGHEFTITSGDSLHFDVEVSDSDGSISNLFISGNPIGSHFTSIPTGLDSVAKSTFSWKPTHSDEGSYIINFIGEDNVGIQTTTSITIIVSDNIVEDCTSSTKRNGYKNGFEWIHSVELGHDIHNVSSKTQESYMEFTEQELHVDTNEIVSVVLTPGYTSREYTEYWCIWIDWNNDGDFGDSDEEVFRTKGKGPVTGQFTIPNHVSGEVKIKVAMGWNNYPPYCGNYINGEIEIYTLSVNQASHSGGGHTH